MYGNEKMRQDVLIAYIDGGNLDPKHDSHVIHELKNLGYLRCGIDTDVDVETLKTTEFGLRYLRSSGVKVRRSIITGKTRAGRLLL